MNNFWFVVVFFSILGCQESNTTTVTTYQKLSGQTMGTTYNITYQSTQDIKDKVETVLKEVNAGVNHYDPNSIISKVNQAKKDWTIEKTAISQHFYTNLHMAQKIFTVTNGAFDPTVMPLINYWGFGYTGKKPVTTVDSIKVDSLLQLVGLDKMVLSNGNIQKEKPSMQLDFSALAKGYGVDKVGEALEQQGIENYLVDIGGEVRAKGVNKRGTPWQLGINTPKAEAAFSDYLAVIALDNQSMATSGNYRNFYELNGIRYAHTINPKTGYPELNTLLSATVISKDCMTADAYATAFMTMGLEKAFKIAQEDKNIHGYFLFSKENGTIGIQFTKGMETFLVK